MWDSEIVVARLVEPEVDGVYVWLYPEDVKRA
jgi:hypothetical protein